jgi:CBS domain-containing protein
MKQHNVGGLAVVDNANQVRAIITERDLLSVFKTRIGGTQVAELMTGKVVTATMRTTIFEAERAMIARSFRRLPIVTGGRIVGIVTAMDIVRFFGSGEVFQHLRSGTIVQVLQTPVLDIGTRKVITTSPSSHLREAAATMEERNIGALLVVDDERLIGIITERDFFKLVNMRTHAHK